MANVSYDTIISNFDNKLTLLQWLKNCDKYLKETETLYSDLDSSVSTLESAVTALNGTTSDLSAHYELLEHRVTAVEDDNTQQEARIDDLGQRVRALEDAPTGGLYKHSLSGLTSTMDNVSYIIDGNVTPITASNFVTRMQNALVIQSSTRQPFTNYCGQNGEYSAAMTWQSGANAFSSVTITFQNVSDSVTTL